MEPLCQPIVSTCGGKGEEVEDTEEEEEREEEGQEKEEDRGTRYMGYMRSTDNVYQAYVGIQSKDPALSVLSQQACIFKPCASSAPFAMGCKFAPRSSSYAYVSLTSEHTSRARQLFGRAGNETRISESCWYHQVTEYCA